MRGIKDALRPGIPIKMTNPPHVIHRIAGCIHLRMHLSAWNCAETAVLDFIDFIVNEARTKALRLLKTVRSMLDFAQDVFCAYWVLFNSKT